MANQELILVKCKIASGAFSGERFVWIETIENPEYIAAVPAIYCLDRRQKALPATSLKTGKVEGVVWALRLGEATDKVKIELPNADVVEIAPSVVVTRKTEHVPI